jgi:hypothetical protein
MKEKEAVQKQAQALKLRLQRQRERDRRALTQVALQASGGGCPPATGTRHGPRPFPFPAWCATEQAKECQQKLERRLEAASRTLTMAEVCRKLESEEEKVRPPYRCPFFCCSGSTSGRRVSHQVLPFYRDTVSEEELVQLRGERPTTGCSLLELVVKACCPFG